MQTIFDHGEYQDILAVLKNKDERVKIQNQLLKTNPSMTVLAAKLNIPGPIKNNKKIESFFIAGLNEFEKMLEKTEIKNLVVLIDDLDRCNPDRIIETLEAIKLFLSVKNTTFIIAADENVIQYAIKKKYPKEHDYDPEIAQEYIEKIIQLPIYIPELSSKDIENYLLLLVCQKYLSEETFKKMLKNIYESKILIREETITLSELHVIISSIPDKKFKNNSDIEFEKDIDDADNVQLHLNSNVYKQEFESGC